VAPDVFGIEEDFGRARVYSQCGNPELVQQAIDTWYVLLFMDISVQCNDSFCALV